MVKKTGLLISLIALLMIAGTTVLYKSYQNRVHETRMKMALAAQARAALDVRKQKAVGREFEELAITSQRRADAIAIDNLRIEDRIRQLEGRPAKNRLAIVQLESKWQYDDLFKSWQDETSKQLELLEKGDPALSAAMQGPLEALLDAIDARRQANATGNEDAKKAAAQAYGKARQEEAAAAQRYEEALRAQKATADQAEK